jgi:hypothetical protein
MAAKSCVNHPERASATMCRRCRKPICVPCTVVTPQGSFCSPECGVMHRAFRERSGEEKAARRTGFFTMAAAIFVMLIVAFVGIHVAASKGVAPAKRIDLIGKVLEKVETLKHVAPPAPR